jgi:hypothetical protein
MRILLAMAPPRYPVSRIAPRIEVRGMTYNNACQKQYADADDFGFGVPEFLNCGFHDDVGFHELHDSVHQKEEDCEAAYDAPGPELCIRNQENLRSQHTLARKIGRDSQERLACSG